MTSGGAGGTSGDRRLWLWPWLAVIAIGLVNLFVNATSGILEARSDGHTINTVVPFILEATSYILWIGLAPLIGLAIRRVPPRGGHYVRFALFHAVMTVVISLIHVGGMVLLRNLWLGAMGMRYDFFGDGVLLGFVYEWRKDVLSYALVAATYWAFERFAVSPPIVPPDASRIELREGNTAVFLSARDILYVESAGNYVAFHTQEKEHLVRGTLAAWEARLGGQGFVRVHRSRLVNRARIGALKPPASGDVDITLDDDRVITGSRRYREALATSM